MIRWMCHVTTKDRDSSQDLLEGMQLADLEKVLCTSGIRKYGHAQCGDGYLPRNAMPQEVVAVVDL